MHTTCIYMFIAKATVIYSLSYELHITFTVVLMTTQPSTLRGTV